MSGLNSEKSYYKQTSYKYNLLSIPIGRFRLYNSHNPELFLYYDFKNLPVILSWKSYSHDT
ncbi:MAG: hypothetical protein ACTSRP_23130 [Candidatus Helarchaeota archaeon]